MSGQLAADLWNIGAGAAAFALFLILHLALWQVLPGPRKGVLFLVLCAAAAYAVIVLLYPLPFLQHCWVSAPLTAFLVVFYMHLYFGIDRSLSVRILGELCQAPDGLSMEELDAVYPVGDMVRRRLDVMLEKKQVELRDGVYHCTPLGKRMVRLALLGKRLYALKMTG